MSTMKWYAAFQRFRQTACIFQFSTLVLPCPDSKCRVVNPTHCTARSLLAKRAKKERSSYVCPQTLPLLLHSNGERDTCSRTCILRGSCLHRVYRLTANACSSTIVCQFGRLRIFREERESIVYKHGSDNFLHKNRHRLVDMYIFEDNRSNGSIKTAKNDRFVRWRCW